MTSLEFSVVVPVYNEAANVARLAEEIADALGGRAYEMIFVDDASEDGTIAVLSELKTRYPTLRVIAHRRNAGQSRAIRSGVRAARGPVIGVLDGDGQNDPKDLIELYRRLTRADAPTALAMVMGRRASRKDTVWKRAASWVANSVRRRFLSDNCDDSGCAIKVFKKDVFSDLPYFDHMHRYMPALMLSEAYEVEYLDVVHRPRRSGRSNYSNIGRLAVAFADLRGVGWLGRRRRSPGGVVEH